jgi:hypothetical protein
VTSSTVWPSRDSARIRCSTLNGVPRGRKNGCGATIRICRRPFDPSLDTALIDLRIFFKRVHLGETVGIQDHDARAWLLCAGVAPIMNSPHLECN